MTAFRLSRLIAIALGVLAAAAAASAAGVERASVELIAPGVYRIDLSATADAWPIAIYPSAKPDTVDAQARPVTARTTTLHVTVPGRQRVYFHLRPASGRTRVVALRQIPLEGAQNLRDLGGYRTADGRYVKWGLLYRSDALARLTAADYETVNGLGLRLICDFRTSGERAHAPTSWQGAPAPETLTTSPGNAAGAAAAATVAPTASFARMSNDALRQRIADIEAGRAVPEFDAFYPRMAAGNVAAYRMLMARIIAGDLPLLHHCTAGQDRTGVFSAILLLALGVPLDTVMEDYLLTNRHRRPNAYIESARLEIQKRLGLVEPPSPETVRFMEDIHPSNLRLGLAGIDEKWGNFDAFLQEGLQLSKTRLEQLRVRLLEY
jgi:protein-tyrosine phosphatase